MSLRASRLSFGLALGGLYGPYLGLLPQLADMPALSARQAILLGRSLGYALTVAVLATLLGWLAALELWRWEPRPQRSARRLLLLLLALPPYFHAAAWQPLAEPFGSWAGAVICQTAALLPLAVGLGWLTLHFAAGPWFEAGRQMQPAGAVLRTIVLPRCRLGAAACLGLVGLLTATDYTVPSLCGVACYAEEVSAQYAAGGMAHRALAVAWPLALLAGLLVLPLARQAAGEDGGPGSQQSPGRLPPWPGALRFGCALGLGALALQVLVPLRFHILTVGSWSAWVEGCVACAPALWTSLVVAAGAAAVGTLLGVGLMELLAAAAGRRGALAWAAALLPLGLPAALLGVGLIDSFNRAWASLCYGTIVMPMLAGGLRYAPLAAVCLAVARRRLEPAVLEAGRLAGGGWRSFARLELVLLKPAFNAAAGLVFALSLGELGATLLVVPPGQGTLTLRLFGLLHYGASAEASAGCLLLWLVLLPLLCSIDRLLQPSGRDRRNQVESRLGEWGSLRGCHHG